jgi:hypothetical protein
MSSFAPQDIQGAQKLKLAMALAHAARAAAEAAKAIVMATHAGTEPTEDAEVGVCAAGKLFLGICPIEIVLPRMVW